MKPIALAILAIGMGYLSCAYKDEVASLIALVASIAVFL